MTHFLYPIYITHSYFLSPSFSPFQLGSLSQLQLAPTAGGSPKASVSQRCHLGIMRCQCCPRSRAGRERIAEAAGTDVATPKRNATKRDTAAVHLPAPHTHSRGHFVNARPAGNRLCGMLTQLALQHATSACHKSRPDSSSIWMSTSMPTRSTQRHHQQ